MFILSRPGAFRYLLLAGVLRAASKHFEAVGDHAVAIEGIGHGAGAPYYLLGLAFLIAALLSFIFGVWRCYLRATGKLVARAADEGDLTNARPKDIAALADVFADTREFDPDEALARYMAKRGEPASGGPSAGPAAAQRPSGGFGRKGV